MAKQSVLSGDRWDSREGKNEFRGSNLKWSLPSNYHFDAFMQRGVYWYFFELLNGIMPQNLPEQILQRIVRLSADGNSLREVARMLGMSEGCISKILRRSRESPTISEEVWRFDENLHATGRPSTAPKGQNEPLHLGSSKNADDPPIGRRMSVWTIRRRLVAAGYWSRRPARCPRLTLEHRRRRREWERRHRELDFRQWRHSIFSDESRFSLYHSDSRVGCAVGKGKGWLMPASSLMMEIVAHQSWYGVKSNIGGGVSWSWWMELYTGIGTSRSWGIKCCHGRRGCLDVTLCTSKTMPRPIQLVTRHPFWTSRMLRSWTGQLGAQTWTQLSMFGIKCQSRSETWMTPPPPPPPHPPPPPPHTHPYTPPTHAHPYTPSLHHPLHHLSYRPPPPPPPPPASTHTLLM